MSNIKLHVVVTSVRPGRVGLPVAKWAVERAKAHGGFDVRLIDLVELNLPVMNEPKHPRLQQYEHASTKQWSSIVSEADAFVFALCEYNYFPPPGFVNAIDYLFHEWHHKPAGIVSYGGVSGGLRSAQAAKLLLTSVNVMPMPEGVSIQMPGQHIENDVFKGTEAHEKSATALFDAMAKWTPALKSLRK